MLKSARLISTILTEDANVANLTLTARSALDGFTKDYGTLQLREITGLAVVSIATPLDGGTVLSKAVRAAFGAGMPSPTMTTVGKNGTRLMSSAADQILVLFDHPTPDANAVVHAKIKGAGYTTDQTDNWVALEITGSNALKALERICPIDLHDSAFAVDQSARTTMEHMGVFIIRTDAQSYTLLSASSSARSFLHAVETSITNVL